MTNTEAENTSKIIEEEITSESSDTENGAEETPETDTETPATEENITEEAADNSENEESSENSGEENKEEAVGEDSSDDDSDDEDSDDSGESDDSNDSDEDSDDSDDAETSEPKESVLKKIRSVITRKPVWITACAVAGAAALVYFGGVIFYSSHFLNGTVIGSFDCSNMTAEDAKNRIQSDIDNYSFTFYEKNDKQETITGEEIYLENSPLEGLDSLKQQQNPFAWFCADKGSKNLPLEIEVTYNEDALYNRLTEMDFMAYTREHMQGKAQNIHYTDGAYTVEDDGTTDIVSLNGMFDRVKPKIRELYKGMSLEKESCYGGLENDDTMKGVLNLLNRYAGTKITYPDSDNPKVLDGSIINEWLSVGDDYSVNISSEKVAEYVDDLAKAYNTVGKERTFKTTGGSEIKVSGGNYGWVVNKKGEAEELMNNIRSGETIEREPVYSQKAGAHNSSDVGNTYVEVSISAQHMWYYKDGNLVVSSDVVTGNPNRGNGTPTGIYTVAYKAKNVVLRGPGYASPVTFWMPFNGGIGLHDARWRGSFGGSIYRGGGSHGCVNLPYSAAQNLYGSISQGDPVVVY